MIYDKTQKEHRIVFHQHMAVLEQLDVKTISASQPRNLTGGGVTIGYSRQFPRAKMVFVGVSYCSQGDYFDRDAGKFHLAGKFIQGEVIQLPLNHLSDKQLTEKLLQLFSGVISGVVPVFF